MSDKKIPRKRPTQADVAKFTLAIALNYFRQSTFARGVSTTNLVMAAALMSAIPMLLLYFFLQEQLIGGIASVGLKGWAGNTIHKFSGSSWI